MKDYIKALTLISDDSYNAFYFENAAAFLEFYYAGDKDIVLMLMECPAFWAWWKNQFEQIDETFSIRYAQADAPAHVLLNIWRNAHDPESMVVYPGQHIIEAAMSKVWSIAWKDEHRLNHLQKQRA